MPLSDKLDDSKLEEFKATYRDNVSVIEDHVNRILHILNHDKTGLRSRQIMHKPITSRMKTLDSAVGSLKRRHKIRLQHATLKTRLEGHGESWTEYWTRRHQVHRIDDVGTFTGVDQMYEALHDIGGIRICVYFPSDAEKVVAFLREHSEIEVERVVLWGQGVAPEIQQLEQLLVDLGTGRDMDHGGPEPGRPKYIVKESPNYRATHVVVKHLGSSSDRPRKRPGVVEIQIANVMMDLCAQLDHDIVYKPGAQMTEEEEEDRFVLGGVLRTFSSIAKAGESALAQLEKYRAYKTEQRSKEQRRPADNAYEFGSFLFSACKAKSLNLSAISHLRTGSWKHLHHLFDVLRATDEHHKLKLHTLLESFLNRNGKSNGAITCILPVHLLREVYEVAEKCPSIQKGSASDVQHIRALAMQAVRCLNLACYLGVEQGFMAAIDKSLPPIDQRPSLTDLLDAVHPHHPRLNTFKQEQITNFCRTVLNQAALDVGPYKHHLLISTLLELPILLSEIGYTGVEARPNTGHGEEDFSIVPRTLCQLLADTEGIHWIPELLDGAHRLIRTKSAILWAQQNSMDDLSVGISPKHLASLAQQYPADPSLYLSRTASMQDELRRIYLEIRKQVTDWNVPHYEFDAKCHPRPYPGYFKPRKPDPKDKLPGWVYVGGHHHGQLEWDVKKINPRVVEPDPEIVLHHGTTSNDGFQELIQATERMETGGQLTHVANYTTEAKDNITEFSLTLSGGRFCLLLCQDKFILKREEDGDEQGDSRE
ncbi:hypothetical protein PG997_011310 [Apiospora hydei]|uniref:RelA/SpoT domain-containing protein n=1 Tax=Apiospora hydei TaxID=1337664 RepID=A0ABR1VJP4_9PEZI